MIEKRIILWSDYRFDYDAAMKDLREQGKPWSDASDRDLLDTVSYDLYEELETLRGEFKGICYDQPLVCIADRELWSGHRADYFALPSGRLSACLYSRTRSADYNEWWVDYLGDLWQVDIHHDGTNYYLYRVFKPGVSPEQQDNFYEKLRQGEATRKDITRLTDRLGPDICDNFGWDCPRTKKGAKK